MLYFLLPWHHCISLKQEDKYISLDSLTLTHHKNQIHSRNTRWNLVHTHAIFSFRVWCPNGDMRSGTHAGNLINYFVWEISLSNGYDNHMQVRKVSLLAYIYLLAMLGTALVASCMRHWNMRHAQKSKLHINWHAIRHVVRGLVLSQLLFLVWYPSILFINCINSFSLNDSVYV